MASGEFPRAGNTCLCPSPTQKTKPKTEPGIPAGELELATLGLAAVAAWEASPLPALLWRSKAQLRTAAGAFKASIKTSDAARTGLSPAAEWRGFGYLKESY